MKFWSDQKVPAQKPLIRLSLLCLQSCTADVRDGVATFLVDADLKKAIGKPAAGLTSRLEGMLEEAFAFTAILDRDMLNTLMLPIGNLLMRSALMIVSKEKKVFDGAKKTPDILQAMYLQVLSEATGNDVSYEPWSGQNVDVAPVAQATEAPKTKPAPFKA